MNRILTSSLLVVTLFATVAARADDRIAYRLKWLVNMSTAGDVAALQAGFFKAEGLDVDLKPGGPERDAIRELELGYADFGVASADQVIKAAAKGSPVVVIAQIFQVNPLQWVYFKDRLQISSTDDLRGKTIGVTFGKNDEYIMRALMAKSGIDPGQVRFFSVRLDYTPFYRDRADLWPVYANTQGVDIAFKLRASGRALGFLNPEDYGVRFVANSVVTSRHTLVRRAGLVRRFLKALLKGWAMIMDERQADRIVTAIAAYDRGTRREVLRKQLSATRTLVQPDRDVPIGRIDVTAWQETEKLMLAYRLIQRPANVASHLSPFGVDTDR